MWNWLDNNSDVMNVVLSALMLLVWALYFQLLLSSYMRSRRSKILINRANGHGLDTQCVVTNMSAEAIYIEGVVAELRGGSDETVVCSLTDHGGRVEPGRTNGEDGYQGPLNSGRSVELGAYSTIIDHALEECEEDIATVRGLKLTVVATYGPEDRPVAAERVYDIVERAGRRLLHSDAVTTRQVRSAAERRRIEALMRRQVAARDTGGRAPPAEAAAE